MKVIFSPAAEQDLEEIGDYIALDNPRRAMNFISGIRKRCAVIAAAPEAAPTRDEIMKDLRMVVYRRRLIFYRLSVGEIRIERILHGARNITHLFD